MEHPIATIQMENGEKIVIALYPEEAPNTVCSFIWLANRGLFDNHKIQRIVPGYVADMSYIAFGKEECKYLIANESRAHGVPNHIKIEPGVVAMGGYDEGIAGGEFFFPLAYHEKLDGHYPGFGKVIENFEEVARWGTVALVPVPYPFYEGVEVNEPADPLVIREVRVDTRGVDYPPPVKLNVPQLPVNWR